MVVATLERAAAGAAGQEHALAVGRRRAAERGVLEGADRHRRHLAPAIDPAWGHAAALAEAAVGLVVRVLERKQGERQLVEFGVGGTVANQELEQAIDQRSFDVADPAERDAESHARQELDRLIEREEPAVAQDAERAVHAPRSKAFLRNAIQAPVTA